MRTILSWRWDRILRLVFGVFAMVQAVFIHDLILGFLGVWITVMAIYNTGCCAAGSCTVNTNRKAAKNNFSEIEVEEIKST